MLFILAFCGLQAFWVWKSLPDTEGTPTVTLGRLLSDPLFVSAPRIELDAAGFCQRWTGLPAQEVDCRSGRAIETLESPITDQTEPLASQARTQIDAFATWLQALHDRIVERDSGADARALSALLVALDVRVGSLRDAREATDYATLFDALLLTEGMAYQPLSGRFSVRRWDPVRLIDESRALEKRGRHAAQTVAGLPAAIFAASALLMIVGRWRAGWVGLACTGFFSVVSTAGLLIAADAAIRFGANSMPNALNPLGAQLERQAVLMLSAHAAMTLIVALAPWTGRLATWLLRHHAWTVWGIAVAVTLSYVLRSPAIGSEALKVGIALIGGTLLADQGRTLHLVRKFAPSTLKPSRWLAALRPGPTARASAETQVVRHVAGPLLNFSMFGALTIAVAALAGHDLGGALIASLMVLLALFLVFGRWPALGMLALMALAAAAMASTDKVQKRIELMLAPMTASASDFARLIAFADAAGPDGFGFGRLPWCNPDGLCLPLQVLSDYMPTLMTGAGGTIFARGLFLALVVYFAGLAGLAFWRFLIGTGPSRLYAAVAGFLLVASLLQTIITFFGNWRLIPLTGLGVPLVSIGLSSLVAPTLAIGLLLSTGRPTPTDADAHAPSHP